MTTAQIYGTALALSEQNRAELAYQLLQSIKPPDALNAEHTDFGAELERRVDAYEAGESTASDWEDVSARLRRALDQNGSAK